MGIPKEQAAAMLAKSERIGRKTIAVSWPIFQADGGKAGTITADLPVVKRGKKPDTKEAVIQQQIADYLTSLGPRCHFDRLRMDMPTTATVGRPDFLCVYQGIPFAIEVKRPGEKVTGAQRDQLGHWKASGSRVAVVHSLQEAIEFINSQCHYFTSPQSRGGTEQE